MTKKLAGLIVALTLMLVAVPPVAAQGASEASGVVVDAEGNPMPGVKLTFTPVRESDLTYVGKTNKKGRYYVQGLFTPQADKMWSITLEAEGYVPVKIRIESRTVNRVLLGPVMEQALKYGAGPPEFPIAKMGHVKVNVTLMTEEEAKSAALEEMVASGELVEGEGEVEGGAGQEPAEPDPWIEATSLASQGEFAASLPKFREAIKDEPEAVERHETYAKVLAHEGLYDDAITSVDAALALEPGRLDTLLVKSQVYIKMGEMEQARAVLDAALEIAPDDMRIYELLVFVAQEGGDPETQIAVYRSIVEIDPEHLEAWLALGDLYAKTGDLDASAEAYNQVVAIDPDNAYKTYYNIAVLILNKDDPGPDDSMRAIDALQRAVQINAEYGPAWNTLGVALLGTGDRKDAVSAFENYLRVSPDSSDAGQIKALVAALNK
jgi:tetratricopeptide (TPR) repeat protein